MLAKLLPAILDKLDIFVMELEELFIPKPDLWEWVWLGSLLATIPAFMASKKSNVAQMRVFQVLLVAAGFLPLLVGAATPFSGVYAFITSEKSSKSCLWRRVSCPSWSEQQLISLGHTLSSHLKSQPRFCNGGAYRFQFCGMVSSLWHSKHTQYRPTSAAR